MVLYWLYQLESAVVTSDIVDRVSFYDWAEAVSNGANEMVRY